MTQVLLNSLAKFANPNHVINESKQWSNPGQKSLSLSWAWHSSAPACLYYYWTCTDLNILAFVNVGKNCLTFVYNIFDNIC